MTKRWAERGDERKEENGERERECVCVFACECVYTSGLGRLDSAGSVIDNCTGFESLDLETRTVAEGEDGELCTHVCMRACECRGCI